jgi:uncharacterized protein
VELLRRGSREEVEELTAKAIDAGGKRAIDPVDLGFVYGASFHDLDGHHWEMVWRPVDGGECRV